MQPKTADHARPCRSRPARISRSGSGLVHALCEPLSRPVSHIPCPVWAQTMPSGPQFIKFPGRSVLTPSQKTSPTRDESAGVSALALIRTFLHVQPCSPPTDICTILHDFQCVDVDPLRSLPHAALHPDCVWVGDGARGGRPGTHPSHPAGAAPSQHGWYALRPTATRGDLDPMVFRCILGGSHGRRAHHLYPGYHRPNPHPLPAPPPVPPPRCAEAASGATPPPPPTGWPAALCPRPPHPPRFPSNLSRLPAPARR